MSIRRIIPLFVLCVLIPVYFSTLSAISGLYKNLPRGDEVNVVLPSPVLKITSLDFDGLASDMLYLKTLVFYGSTISGNQRRAVKEYEYKWMYDSLTAATDLDPYFLDPYFFANAVLTWEGNRVKETNILLEKGSRYREWDYWLPFYLGFNYFYFLGENEKAATYLIEASKKPGASPFYGHLGARLAYKSNKVENAIIFLEGMLDKVEEKTMRNDYELRLKALRSIFHLQKGMAVYKEKTGRDPVKISEMLDLRIINSIPADPYGGEFYIDKEGEVRTTSDLRLMK